MILKVLLPKQVLVEEMVRKVTAEGQNGSFCLLPRHIDFVSALVPGLLVYETAVGAENYLAIDEGILVKCGPEVLVSTRNAVQGADLGQLQALIREQFAELDEREQQTRSALAKIEADFVRRFLEL
ncbi:MAG TPA: F0F1 ATP synthase subunit epsilon [Chloroflexota bacterium]|nr:F0F1 ATP synthase subunit epsilon [Chloroflexota bacterium]